jgi:1,4-dihydroxy-2-naphthoate octaprenyltransferase
MKRIKVTPWIHAIRPKTLPLSLSGAILGSFLAVSERSFRWDVFFLACSTTLLLQILANLANDYGDFIKGTDDAERVGPKRMLQSGEISPEQMIRALMATAAAASLSGIALVFAGTEGMSPGVPALYLLLGCLCIAAAVKYTMGKNPYGYMGLGDISVFIFFGLIGVFGTYFLHTHTWKPDILLPASSIGLLSTGVLNMNNLRDYENDKKGMKRTMVVFLGVPRSKIYHTILITGALLAGIVYVIFNYRSPVQFLFLLSLPPFLLHLRSVFLCEKPAEMIAELQRLSFSTLFFALSFGLGMMLG